jgi:hypothetical protein
MARRSDGTLRIMTASELDAAALRPPQKERACLAERLLESLEILSSEERDELWAAEALRRDAEMDAVAGQVRDNDSVFASHGLGGRDEARLARGLLPGSASRPQYHLASDASQGDPRAIPHRTLG